MPWKGPRKIKANMQFKEKLNNEFRLVGYKVILVKAFNKPQLIETRNYVSVYPVITEDIENFFKNLDRPNKRLFNAKVWAFYLHIGSISF